MISKIGATLQWLPYYLAREVRRTIQGERVPPKHIYFCICDHFEPYWNGANKKTARKRIQRWLDEYPKIADKYRDSGGNVLKYSFFYPEEEYQVDDLNALAELCHAGYGEVEIHLHHDNDTSENLRRTLIDYKRRLHEKHGLLSLDKKTGEIVYGFIHGNWALCNSRKDGRWCGVNDEIKILQETGCYADFTLPSAPSDTQTRKVNSIYYAVDKPGMPKSHDWGVDAEVGKRGEGLLMVQGPLALNFSNRKWGVLPRIENSGLYGNGLPTLNHIRLWIDSGVSVRGAPDHVFVKLYTHGAQEGIMRMLFDEGGFVRMFSAMQETCASVSYVSAREMVNIIKLCENSFISDAMKKN
jgi:hypothetical protein